MEWSQGDGWVFIERASYHIVHTKPQECRKRASEATEGVTALITVGDDVAFTHSLNRISGTRTTGQKTDLWVRMTACFRKINGKWLIMHTQVSVPVDLEHGKAVLDLQP